MLGDSTAAGLGGAPLAHPTAERHRLRAQLGRVRRGARARERVERRQPRVQRGDDPRQASSDAIRRRPDDAAAARCREARAERAGGDRVGRRQRPPVEHADPLLRRGRQLRQPRRDRVFPAAPRDVHPRLPRAAVPARRAPREPNRGDQPVLRAVRRVAGLPRRHGADGRQGRQPAPRPTGAQRRPQPTVRRPSAIKPSSRTSPATSCAPTSRTCRARPTPRRCTRTRGANS